MGVYDDSHEKIVFIFVNFGHRGKLQTKAPNCFFRRYILLRNVKKMQIHKKELYIFVVGSLLFLQEGALLV